MHRPFFKYTLSDLERLYEESHGRPDVILNLEFELSHRSTDRAKALTERVQEARNGRPSVQPTFLDLIDPANETIVHPLPAAEETNVTIEDASLLPPDRKTAVVAPVSDEDIRVHKSFEKLRERLLDRNRLNPMLNYKHAPRSKQQLRLVHTVLDDVRVRLLDGAALDIAALPEPEDVPADEKTDEFHSALEHAKVSDIEYLTKVEAAEAENASDFELAKIERWLRDKIRALLELPARPNRKTLDLAVHARENGVDPSFELKLAGASPGKFLHTLHLPDDLEARIEKIIDQARLAEQEMGLSTLFLAIGFVEWYEADSSDRTNFAPLLLMPVKIESRTIKGHFVYSIVSTGEPPETNITLLKYLELQFNRTLPIYKDEDGEADTIESYFAEVSEALSGLKRWSVRNFLTLGHFSFGRLAMYEDLNPERWHNHPAKQALVGTILTGIDQTAGDQLPSIPDDYEMTVRLSKR